MIAAFFDFDKTLLSKESAELGIKYVWKQGLASPFYMLKVGLFNIAYKRQWIDTEIMSRACLTFYKGRDLRPLIEGSEDFYRTMLEPALSPIMLKKLEWHRSQGHKLVLLSGSLRYLLAPAALALQFDELICTDLELGRDGFATGRTDGPFMLGEQKKKAAIEFADNHDIDLGASFAYADHPSDIELLKTVGHPIIVRPGPKFRKTALAHHWEIVDDE